MNKTGNNYQIHIKFNIFRILSYLMVYGIFGVLLFIYLRGYISLIILTVFIAIPLSETIIAYKLAKTVQVSLNISDENINVGDRIGIGIVVENKSRLSGLNLLCEIGLDNIYLDTKQTQKVLLPVHPRKRVTNPIIFDSAYIGMIQAALLKYTVSDVFGFINVSFEYEGNAGYVKILPMTKDLETAVRESLVLGVNDNEDNSKKGNELAETGSVREYIPGDRIKDIHWKLSAKRDLLLVKERISTSESRLVLWIGSSSGRKVCEMILSVALEIMNSCVEEGRLMEAFWYDYHNRTVECFTVENKKNIYTAFEKIYFGGHGEQPDSIMNLLAADGYSFNDVLGVGFDGNEIRVDLYEA